MASIILLIERNLDFTPDKIIAASIDRKALIEKAQERNLSIDPRRLDERGSTKVGEFCEVSLEEIEIIERAEIVHAHAPPSVES